MAGPCVYVHTVHDKSFDQYPTSLEYLRALRHRSLSRSMHEALNNDDELSHHLPDALLNAPPVRCLEFVAGTRPYDHTSFSTTKLWDNIGSMLVYITGVEMTERCRNGPDGGTCMKKYPKTVVPDDRLDYGPNFKGKKLACAAHQYDAEWSRCIRRGSMIYPGGQSTGTQAPIPQPAVAQPAVAQSAVAQPVISQAGVPLAGVPQAVVPQSAVAQPAVAQPAVARPVIFQPVVSQPVGFQVAAPEAVASQSAEPHPIDTQQDAQEALAYQMPPNPAPHCSSSSSYPASASQASYSQAHMAQIQAWTGTMLSPALTSQQFSGYLHNSNQAFGAINEGLRSLAPVYAWNMAQGGGVAGGAGRDVNNTNFQGVFNQVAAAAAFDPMLAQPANVSHLGSLGHQDFAASSSQQHGSMAYELPYAEPLDLQGYLQLQYDSNMTVDHTGQAMELDEADGSGEDEEQI